MRRWFAEQKWKPATCNRYKTTLSLVYRLGIEHKKVKTNPARLLKRKREDNERIRFLGQVAPAKTDDQDLKKLNDEEARLRIVARDYPAHMPELLIALHTGMRPSEQYSLTWDRIDLLRKLISIPKSKNGKARHIPLNTEALAAFAELKKRPSPNGFVFVNMDGARLCGYTHWFEPAVDAAGIRDFTWYCLRHTFASRLVMGGVDLRTVAELMGHKTIQMTMRYAHLAPEHNLAAVQRFVSFNLFGSGSIERSEGEPVDSPPTGAVALAEPSATTTATMDERESAFAPARVQ